MDRSSVRLNAGADLVEEDDPGLGHHRPAKLEQLLLPAGERARTLGGDSFQAEERDDIPGAIANLRFLGPDHAAAEPGVDPGSRRPGRPAPSSGSQGR